MKKLIFFALIIGIVGFGHYSRAEVLTFDNLSSLSGIPNGYGGLNWNNTFTVVDGVNLGTSFPSGYTNGVVSPNNVAFNNYGNVAFITPGTMGPTFNFFGGYFTGAWNDGMSVEIVGSRNGTVLFDNTITVNTTTPTLFTTDYSNINELDFISYGGTPNANFAPFGYGNEFVMDNVTVPEPSSLIFLGLGLAGLCLNQEERRSLAPFIGKKNSLI